LVLLLPVLLLSLLVVFGTSWFLRPRLPASIEIAGHSMLPTLWGRSLEMSCQDCGYPLRCSWPVDADTILCPNCSYDENLASSASEREPDRVQLTPLAQEAPIARWDLVALQLPGESQYAVKRVVGLPGESIRIQGGELLVDDLLLEKSWNLFQQLRVEVHHLGFRPASQLRRPASRGDGPSTWKPLHQPSGWTSSYPFHFQPREEGRWDHLVLERQPAIPGLVTPPGQPLGGIVDYHPANQGLARPRLHAVRDVMVEAEVARRLNDTFRDASSPEGFTLEIQRGNTRYRAHLDLQQYQVELHVGQDVVACHDLPRSQRGHWKIGLAIFDGQLVLVSDAGIHQVPGAMDERGEEVPTIMVGARGAGLKIEGLRVWRDIHWLDPDMTDESWSPGRRLGEDEYFLLGDNPPVSQDSRQWRAPVRRQDILGTVR
jgi:signal peptidase I